MRCARILTLLLAALLLSAALDLGVSAQGLETAAGPSLNVVETAQDLGSFDTFLHAIEAAGLTPTLEENGPFTLLLPTDEAFDQLPEGAMKQLLKPDNIEQLIRILTYHVIPDELSIDELSGQENVRTVQDTMLSVSFSDDEVQINGARVLERDIRASNGILHAIDQVLLPPAKRADLDVP